MSGSGEWFRDPEVMVAELRRAEIPRTPAIPGYEVRGEVHRGGQGVVYEAIQRSTERRVAIKVLREGRWAGPAERARFRREVRALSALSHPFIVAIHDSGATEDSAVYCVMDYVGGRPIDAHAAGSGVDEVIALFEKVCEGVGAAHLRGVIHRDLKPSNILVDAQGNPRILDFGLAKLLSEEGPEAVSITRTGGVQGSLPFMSPEQASGAAERVDVRSDIYSLGVILYRSLTGRPPYDTDGTAGDAFRAITGAEPLRPRSVRRDLGADLETIVLKCLAKEPERRYQSAADLARDLAHCRLGEPIDARRDSTWYVLRKALRRHRLGAGLAAASVVLLLAATAVSAAFWRRAELEARGARTQATKAEEVSAFLSGMLDSLDPRTVEGRDISVVRELLNKAAARLETELADQPDVRATLHMKVARLYRNLGEPALGLPHARRCLEIRRTLFAGDHPAVAEGLLQYCAALTSAHHPHDEETKRTVDESLAMHGRLYGPESLEYARALEAWVFAHDDVLSPEQMITYQVQLLGVRRGALGEAHQEVAQTLDTIAMCYSLAGDKEAAVEYLRQALAVYTRALGPDDPTTIYESARLALRLAVTGRAAEGEPLARRAVGVLRDLPPPGSGRLREALLALGWCLCELGRAAEAEPYLRECVEIGRARTPKGTMSFYVVAISESVLGDCLRALGKFEEAEPLVLGAVPVLEEALGAGERRTLQAVGRAVRLYDSWEAAAPGEGHGAAARVWRERLEEAAPAGR